MAHIILLFFDNGVPLCVCVCVDKSINGIHLQSRALSPKQSRALT